MNETYKPEEKRDGSVTEQPMTRDLFYQMARQKFSYTFLKYSYGPERIAALIAENQEEIEVLENAEEIKSQLEVCLSLDDRDQYVEAVFQVLKPVLDKIFDTHQQVVISHPEERVLVANELLTYDIKGDKLFIHVFSGGLDGKIGRYAEGLATVATTLETHQEVKMVEAWSWIVVQHPKILERLGFTVEKDGEGRPIVFGDQQGHASMSREDFLMKYLKKEA
jgi:hypothetical protein